MNEEEIEKLMEVNEKYSRILDRLDELYEDGELEFDQYFYLVGGSYEG